MISIWHAEFLSRKRLKFYMIIRLIARKVVFFWLGYESGERVFLVNAILFINGMRLNELGY